jgi:energy-coupling factor transport system ATP-binding protein
MTNSEREGVLVEVRGVTYTHWNQTVPTLKNVSFQIQKGTLNFLVGPGGSGKSTLCDLFNGVIPHLHGGKLEGEVLVAGVSTQNTQVHKLSLQIGRVFQDPEVMFSMLYVEDEIAFGPENLRIPIPEIQEIVERLLDQADLSLRRSNLVWNLSGGQVQKLGLACVLAMEPELIVLDEPTSNLDPGATRSVHELILELRKQGITVLLVTRELDEFLAEADQLIVLEEGHILASGSPQEVLAEHGQYMVESLGIWLPETSEIAIELAQAGALDRTAIPVRVAETTQALLSGGLLLPGSGEALQPFTLPAYAAEKVLISGRDLHFSYPGGVHALRGISLDIQAGEWLMILGRNGAGKSTLSRLLVGMDKPQQGTLSLFGRDAHQWRVPQLANHIALVFQNPEHQFLTDTVENELEYSLLAKGVSDPAKIEERRQTMLRQLGLEAFSGVHPLALSAGLKRRLGVATMLVGQPDLLLVDEPTYGQDKAMTHTLMDLMQQIRDQGVSVVMITHDMRLVQEYAGRVVVMSEGLILYDGPAERLFEMEEILYQANLRRTLLHELLADLTRCGFQAEKPIRRTADLVEQLLAASREAAHG